MRLKKLKLKNFKKYQSKEFTFFEGTIGIVGLNGSGKSSIFEAILFALYGDIKTKLSKELIKHTPTKIQEPLSVELEFTFENSTFSIMRTFQGRNLLSKASLHQNNQLIATGSKNVTQSISLLLQMPKDIFSYTLFSSQKELNALSHVNTLERQKIIRKLLGVEQLDIHENYLMEQIKEIQLSNFSPINSIIELNNGIENLDILKEIKKLQIQKEQSQKLQIELKIILSSIQTITLYRDKILIDIEKINQKKAQLASLRDIKERYTSISEQLEEFHSLKEISLRVQWLLQERKNLQKAYLDTKSDIYIINESLSHEPFLQHSLDELLSLFESLNLEYEWSEEEIKALELLISQEKYILSHTKEQIEKIEFIGQKAKCPTCQRELLEVYDEVLSHLYGVVQTSQNEKLQRYHSSLRKKEAKKIKLKTKLKEIEEQKLHISQELHTMERKKKELLKLTTLLKSIEIKGTKTQEHINELIAYRYDKETHENLKKEFDEVKKLYHHSIGLEALIAKDFKIEEELSHINQKLDKFQNDYAIKEQELHDINYDENIYLSFIKLQEAQHLQEKVLSFKESAQITQKLSHYQMRLKTLRSIKNQIHKTISPLLSQVTSQLYAQMSNQKYQWVQIDEHFDFYIYEEEQRYPLERFSDGEIDLFNLALRVAISKIISLFYGSKSISILAFDEIFSSQDKERIEFIMNAFEKIKPHYSQIFFISHNSDMKAYFEHLIEI